MNMDTFIVHHPLPYPQPQTVSDLDESIVHGLRYGDGDTCPRIHIDPILLVHDVVGNGVLDADDVVITGIHHAPTHGRQNNYRMTSLGQHREY